MFIIPVIDLLGGVVVKGVAGRRAEYLPLVSQLVSKVTPSSLASVFANDFGFHTLYLADLDAITGKEPNRCAYREITASGLTLWLDAGIRDVRQAQRLISICQRDGIHPHFIVGLESLDSLNELAQLVELIGADRAVLSLDMKAGVPMTSLASSPHEIAACVREAGFRRLIVLDLADVGMSQGITTLPLIRALREQYPTLEIIAGGGVRDQQDLTTLATHGCSAALVASALHDRQLTIDHFREFIG